MKAPPFKCLFCISTKGPFERIEHTIPESLGNDDTFLPPGFVCDPCNQYFGAKVEQPLLASPLFCMERVAAAVKTKKGKYPRFVNSEVAFHPTGSWGQLLYAATPNWVDATLVDGCGHFYTDQPQGSGTLMARLMLKMGLELLALSGSEDPLAPVYNNARYHARYGKKNLDWTVGYGMYPRRNDLLIGTRSEGEDTIETHQLYDCELGEMPSGDRIFWFAYVNHCFACNLSGPNLSEYLIAFNQRNEFKMRIIKW